MKRPPALPIRTPAPLLCQVLQRDKLPLTQPLTHDLSEAFEHFKKIKRRKQLHRDRLYQHLNPELDKLLNGFAWNLKLHAPKPQARVERLSTSPPQKYKAVAWNIERGKRFESLSNFLLNHPEMNTADLLLLTEVDVGMGRSGNRNVPAALAELLGMDYVFANHHLLLSPGDPAEQKHTQQNTLAMHGSALLSRFPIRRFSAVALPEYTDKFHASEKRLGDKRTLLCEVELPDGPLTVLVVHLDPFAPPRHRTWQMRCVMKALHTFGGERVLLGGDLNTSSFNLANGPTALAKILSDLTRRGVEKSIQRYMAPEFYSEKGIFKAIDNNGLTTQGYNDLSKPTFCYETFDPDYIEKTRSYLPDPFIHRLNRLLEPWEGRVPLRLDWFAGRSLTPSAPAILKRPEWEGSPVSDHDPILIDFC